MPLTFVTGPVRSGKSRFAERLALASGRAVTYVATARVDPNDAEWTARLAHHAARRPPGWRLVETATGGRDLAGVVRAAGAGDTLLVDSLGTWLADRMSHRREAASDAAALDGAALEGEFAAVAEALLATPALAIVVGEEVGWDVVPAYPAGRVFRDVLGRGQAMLARRAGRAYLVVAGFALDLQRLGTPVEDS